MAKPKRPAVPAAPPTVSVSFRLPTDLIARLDGYVELLRSVHPGFTLTRSDAVRDLLTRGLDESERGGK